MKKALGTLLLLVCFLPMEAQLNCKDVFTCRVTAPSGMRLRATPSTKGKIVGKVPYDSLVVACRETFGDMTYEKQEGFWRKVSYKDISGYMFDGFLEITALGGPNDRQYSKLSSVGDSNKLGGARQSVAVVEEPPGIASTTKSENFEILTEAYNYCGDVAQLDPTLLWYGFYPMDDDQGPNLRVKPVDLEVVMSKIRLGKKMEFDIGTSEQEHSIFLLGVEKPLDYNSISIEDQSEKLRYAGRKVFPGQERVLNQRPMPLKLTATGTVTSSGPCPDLKNYKLLLKGDKFGQTLSQDITAELMFKGQCGMPEIFWYGDFTGDGLPEIIFVSVYDEKNHFTLFLSDPRSEKLLVVKKAEWIIDKCY